jgi:hypothetical protein
MQDSAHVRHSKLVKDATAAATATSTHTGASGSTGAGTSRTERSHSAGASRPSTGGSAPAPASKSTSFTSSSTASALASSAPKAKATARMVRAGMGNIKRAGIRAKPSSRWRAGDAEPQLDAYVIALELELTRAALSKRLFVDLFGFFSSAFPAMFFLTRLFSLRFAAIAIVVRQ